MNRKYRQAGYQESDREERDRRRPPQRRPLTQEEKIQRRSLRHAIDREANEVVRCHNCGRTVSDLTTVAFDTACPHCRSALHCCRACRHFDTSARWQCRTDVSEAIGDKLKPNTCAKYEPQLVLDVTGRRTNSARSNDPRAQFESLFKR
jgi:DNA-directed RNA polymerase subunit RPC12/RpoP